MIIDTHCHLSAPAFQGDLDGVLLRAREAGVGCVISIASDLDDSDAVVRMIRRRSETGPATESHGGETGPRLFATAGIHPHEVASLRMDEAEGVIERLKTSLERPHVVAVGECGLDFHYDLAPHDVQRVWFRRQIDLAASMDLPVVVHCRDAEEDMIPMVREAGEAGVRGVLHCFPGDLPLLEAAMDAGWYVSFTGIVTFRNFGGETSVREVPADRYFLETDGPYLAPVPHRGKRNEPAFVRLTGERVAELRGESFEAVARTTTANACDFFRLPKL